MPSEDFARRTVLRGVGAGIAGTALVGQASATDVRDDEYVVGVEPDSGLEQAREAADEVRRELDFGSIGRAVSGRFSENAVEVLENNPNVRYVEPNGLMWALEQETPYGIEQVDADLAIDEGETGDGVSVAVIDTGIDAQHETLEANLGEGYATEDAACTTDCGGGPFGGGNDIDDCLEEWDDDNDHGTHCAGTAGAADDGTGVLGVAPDATLHAVKVLQCDGGGTLDDIAAGIQWSADQGHDVQNMSLGSDTDSDVVRDAVQYADERGVVMVAAAGNDGPCTDCVGYPAAYDEVIAVSATDEDDDLADFSSTGPEVDIAAPGVDVLSTIPRDDYDEFSGTSMSSPHVAGAAATLIAAGTDPADVRAELTAAADDVGLDDNEQGAGRLNVADALDIEGSDDDDDDEDDDDPADADPVIDTFAVERSSSGPWSNADVDWAVSHEDSALESVTTELLADSNVLESESSSVGGASAAGEHELRSRDDPDTVRLTAVDESGTAVTETTDY
ncbi:subtilisin-like serine protease [Natronococcus amylolyticus DSM 10524]|uniref:Subtilisin-like serine protease n=1 Tax=Natronococcus amylolyticus DSM 10524 TaxID=1227497 RepID=L9XKY4_9EURY|nr:S8 family peptidase [Natronococcus amylolyticus]ELY61308.1 subtilisin-like serine protease [Natronococcus amylolyticus DSM 10524]